MNFAATIDFEQTRQTDVNTVYVTIRLRHCINRSPASGSLIGYNILQQRERTDMFIIARKHITPRRMLYRARILLESCSYRNCNRPITMLTRLESWLNSRPVISPRWKARTLSGLCVSRSLPDVLCMLPMAVARSFSGGVAICYVLPVF